MTFPDITSELRAAMPALRGRLLGNEPLAPLTWFRVGGPAQALFTPADEQDLGYFLAHLPSDIPVCCIGVGSNLIVRDGGLPGVVIRLSPRGFGDVRVDGDLVQAGTAALDRRVAEAAAAADLGGLEFLFGIPGTIGGALRMNAGCYGSYMADVFVSARAVGRDGVAVALSPQDLAFAYRATALPAGMVVTEVVLRGVPGAPAELAARMERQLAARDASQPTGERSAGSTFRNPAGFSSTGLADDVHDFKAWKLIEDAGMRGASLGGAQMSPKHANFLINAGGAKAADLENLGELVRKKVFETSGIALEWEIMRIGRP